MKLTAKAVEKLRHEGALHFRDIKDDGTPGLYLRILGSGEKRWIVRYKLGAKTRVGTFGDAARSGSRTRAQKRSRGTPSSARGAIRLPKNGARPRQRSGCRESPPSPENTSSGTPSRTNDRGARTSGCFAMTCCRSSAICASTPSRGATSCCCSMPSATAARRCSPIARSL